MEKNRLILALVLSMVVIYGWTFLRPLLMGTPPPPAPATQPLAPATAPAVAEAPPEPGPRTLGPGPRTPEPGTQPSAPTPELAPASQPLWHVRGAEQVETAVLGQDTPAGQYYLQAVVTNRGAAVERALLVAKEAGGPKTRYAYARSVEGDEPYPVLEPLELPGGRQVPSWATESVRLVGPEVTLDLADVPWEMDVQREDGAYVATFSVDILRQEEPVGRIVKRYRVEPERFAVTMDLEFQALTDEPLRLVVSHLGPVGIRREDPRYDYRKIFAVLNKEGQPDPVRWQHAQLAKKGPANVGGALPIWWLALVDKYFAAVTAPVQADGAASPVAEAQIFAFTNDPQRTGDLAMRMTTPPVTVEKAKPARLTYDLFIGPKEPRIFEDNALYAERHYMLLRSAEYAWCTFAWLGELLIKVLHFFYRWVWPHNYGLAIVILVLLVRALLHPLTKHQGVTMARMQAKQAEVQPKLEVLKKQFANDKQKLQAEMMRVYRESGINPAGQLAGCLPMVIQLPIWVALYSALNYDINLWHEPFAWWIKDLSAPDAAWSWSAPVHIPVASWMIGPVDKLNVLPILLAIAMYLQQKFTPKPKVDTNTQAGQQQVQMQKMMGFMMLFMGLLFYNMPSGLNLYIMASSTFGMLEQRRIRQHIAQQKQLPAAPKPKPHRPGFFDRVYGQLEKRARDSQTIRKGK